MEETIKPVCPHCKTEMDRVLYKGYYESFAYWECECGDEDVKLDVEHHGSYA